MKCEYCPQRVQPEWKYCPACGKEITVATEDRLRSSGVKYFPQAFEEAPYKCGRAVAETAEFYEVFLRFMLATVEDPSQIVHFRSQVESELKTQAGNKEGVSKVEIRWCALSIATDKYFADKARAYDWSLEEEEKVRSAWLEMLAMAFLPSEGESRSLDIKILRGWIKLFRQLHQRESGPLPTCSPCQSKCLYQCEAAEITQSARVRSDYQATVSRHDVTAAEGAAIYCRLLSERLIGKYNKDLSYCLAVHLVKDLETSPGERRMLSSDAQLVMSKKVHAHLENMEEAAKLPPPATDEAMSVRAQVFEVIVRQAIAGAPWQEICAQPMRIQNITVEEVQEEVKRRKELS
jgi:hypothetical protein